MLFVGLFVFGISAIAIPSRSTYGAQVSVDEPQYLLTALSIGEDLNLDISDEIEEEKFRTFHEVGLNTQTIDMNSSGQRLSPHDPLLPLLLSGPMRIGGWVGARVLLAIFAGLLASTTLWVAVRRFKVSPKIAAWVVGSFGAAPPLCSYGSQIYPEVPAALAVILAIATITGPRSKWNSIGFVLSITALPWLSIKYLPVAFTIFLLASLSNKKTERKRISTSTAVVFVLMAAIYLLSHQLVYQGWTVYSAGDHFAGSEFEVIEGYPTLNAYPASDIPDPPQLAKSARSNPQRVNSSTVNAETDTPLCSMSPVSINLAFSHIWKDGLKDMLAKPAGGVLHPR